MEAFFGVFVMCLVSVGKESDYHFENAEYEITEEKTDRAEELKKAAGI